MNSQWLHDRRKFLGVLAYGTVVGASGICFAEELTKTPAQTEGPFYPDKLPLDTDNDLLIITNNMTSGIGEVTHVTGRVLSASGEPLKNSLVEIWQCDNGGAYLHSGTDNNDKRDKNFQGYGRFLTNIKGEYYFRTIKPVPYPGRTPHIHYKVTRGSKHLLTTQLYVKDHPGNARDGLYMGVRDPKLRDAITADFAPLKGSKIGELTASFDLVIGVTPDETKKG